MASACPIPDPAPVTTATFPAKPSIEHSLVWFDMVSRLAGTRGPGESGYDGRRAGGGRHTSARASQRDVQSGVAQSDDRAERGGGQPARLDLAQGLRGNAGVLGNLVQ